ncbi:GNAT family N-acetyltransferase [Actinoplanes sp. CA-030573]|uniref:GNAT family N-acetyltransferase n=1 Tax=Actinoplanes sp. CA-030573 TaxID=3239898 RepID=UPI003D9024E6
MPSVVLRPFTEDLLPTVQPWFHDPEVNRWLGGPEWPALQFRIDANIGEVFRGRRALRVHSWLAYDETGVAVAHIGGDVYDRWCRYTEGPDGPVVDRVEPGPAMGFAYVVDPARRRRGFGAATIRALMAAPEVADVVLFAAGIEPGNVASARCAVAAGLLPDALEPDWEDIVHYVRRRDPRPGGGCDARGHRERLGGSHPPP